MNENTKEKRVSFIFRFSVIVSVLSLLVVFVTTGIQVYIRWFFNKDFLLIGGTQLEVLTVSAFILISVLTYIYRQERN